MRKLIATCMKLFYYMNGAFILLLLVKFKWWGRWDMRTDSLSFLAASTSLLRAT